MRLQRLKWPAHVYRAGPGPRPLGCLSSDTSRTPGCGGEASEQWGWEEAGSFAGAAPRPLLWPVPESQGLTKARSIIGPRQEDPLVGAPQPPAAGQWSRSASRGLQDSAVTGLGEILLHSLGVHLLWGRRGGGWGHSDIIGASNSQDTPTLRLTWTLGGRREGLSVLL